MSGPSIHRIEDHRPPIAIGEPPDNPITWFKMWLNTAWSPGSRRGAEFAQHMLMRHGIRVELDGSRDGGPSR